MSVSFSTITTEYYISEEAFYSAIALLASASSGFSVPSGLTFTYNPDNSVLSKSDIISREY